MKVITTLELSCNNKKPVTLTIKSQGTEDAEHFQLQGKSVEEGTYKFQRRMCPLQSLL